VLKCQSAKMSKGAINILGCGVFVLISNI